MRSLFRLLSLLSLVKLISRGDVGGIVKRQVRRTGYRQVRRAVK